MKRPIILLKSKENTSNKGEEISTVPQTILLKTRDGEKRAVSPQASSSKYVIITVSNKSMLGAS